MTAPPDLTRLAPGDRVQDPFLVLEVETRSGDHPHTVLTLGNSTGSIQTAPFWAEEQSKIAGIGKRSVVQIIGEVATYRDKRQLKVSSIRVLPTGTVEPARLLPSVGDVSRYWAYVDRLRGEIKGPRLRAVLDLFYEDPEFRERYEQCPGSTIGHHAEIGGLLKHTSEVLAIAQAIARAARADEDLVTAGVLLHDIGKLEAYRWDGAFEATELNALQGHVVLGAFMLDRTVRAASPSPCSDQELAILTHLVLSHHGKQEFGAPVPPLTLEAEVIHYADNASAKTSSMAEAINTAANFAEGALVSSQGVWQVDRRRVYRGKSDWGRSEE
ncbi:MAG: HD domain-containing protein [Gemmatimonadales bacterium]|nr:HD domain-containing protein [Gemmatimonadales bacterium]